jgi:hypothetical protein
LHYQLFTKCLHIRNMKLTIISKTYIFILIVVLFGCKKEKKEEKNGLIPSVENLSGTWTLQKSSQYFTNNNRVVIPGGGTFANQPNNNYYIFNSDGSFSLKTMLQDGSNFVYSKNGSYNIIETSFEEKPMKEIVFDNDRKGIFVFIQYIDTEYLELHTVSNNYGSTSRYTDYYAKIK